MTVKLLEREEKILDFTVRDYVKTASPVSSHRIFKKIKMEASPATIRNAMFRLEKFGFLEKKHTSSGRIPTDKAYRYFVDNCMQKKYFHKQEALKESSNAESQKFNRGTLQGIIENLSHDLNVFISAGFFKSKRFLNKGSEFLLQEPEFEERKLVRNFGFLLDHLEDLAETVFRNQLENHDNKDVTILIGEENFVKEARTFSLFAGGFKNSDKEDFMLISLCPRRTNYETNHAELFYAINHVLKKII